MRLCRPVCDPGNRCKNKKRDGTECGAALDKEGKHATTCPCGHALSARHNALRDEIANIARRTGLCADIEVLVDHHAIDPENGAKMDVRISKPGFQNADELIDVQVTTPFCVEAASLVGKAMERCVPLNNKLWIDEHVCKYCKVWMSGHGLRESWLDMKMCTTHECVSNIPRDKQERTG